MTQGSSGVISIIVFDEILGTTGEIRERGRFQGFNIGGQGLLVGFSDLVLNNSL
jgi:hypothetical protein